MQQVRDRLGVGANPESLRSAAFTVISRTQDTPATQIMGTAVALVAACEAVGADIRQVLESAERIMRDIDSPYSSTIRAIREYARNEIKRMR